MTDITDYRLEDRYDADTGRVLLTGIQALTRIPVDQLRNDRRHGLNTAALLSGYPGSPLGGLDLEIARAVRQVKDLPIVHQPAVNEELAASAVMGSQLASTRPDARYDGVVGIWYGKAPGLDRATDALRHGVFAGSSPKGGALAVVGDDPMAKSSTMPSSSDAALVDLHMPILYPGTSAECLELGLHGVAMSRASGLWSSLKVVTPVADGSGTVDLPVLERQPVMPTIEINGTQWASRPNAVFLGPRMVEVEREFREVRLELAHQYGVQNNLNRVTVDSPDAWIGLVATGFTYHQLLEALRRLGLPDEASIGEAGIRLLHLRMPVPFDRDRIRDFARGLDQVLVIEEKNPTLEWLIKDALYAMSERPVVLGKTNEDDSALMPSFGRLDADTIVTPLRSRLSTRLETRLKPLEQAAPKAPRERIPLTVNRTPFFCSGCPHNWGTKVPEGMLVGAGTGCHGMSLLMDAERVGETIGITAMGNEGAHWIGMSPFVDTPHIVQNFGDGTYFHSGQLAVQAAIGAGANITFKILYNDTVAMTGGQEASFRVGVPELVRILDAQGVARVLITTDELDGYERNGLPPGCEVWDRTRILEAQEVLSTVPGVTVLINHQPCAAELRRDRKRGRIERPRTRIVINHRICEGCGDCGDKSNCLSVQPTQTALGRKTQIDQATCNFDYSCVEGDCPAFMKVVVSDTHAGSAEPPPLDELPQPTPRTDLGDRVAIRLAGIGGTGVVTVAQVLSTAAMFDGWDVNGLDQTGLSQKAGPVVSDVVLTRAGIPTSNLVGAGEADTVLAFDALVAAGDGAVAAVGERTRLIGSSAEVPTGAMISSPEIGYPELDQVLGRMPSSEPGLWMDAVGLTEALLGDAAPANILMLGVAVQSGAIPVSPAAIERAIDLNGVAVAANLAAFGWGRRWAVDPDGVSAALVERNDAGLRVVVPALPEALARRVEALGDDDLRADVALRAADLVGYQGSAYAERYLDVVEPVARTKGADGLAAAVARSLHKLMAYKDEYEVARLIVGPEAKEAAESVGGSGAKPVAMLHPPALRRFRSKKMAFGPATRPVLRALAASRGLRGTRFDPFGRSTLRRLERELITEYISTVETLLSNLRPHNLDDAVAIAELPDQIRGYEDLKLRRIDDYRASLASAMANRST